jgi:SH3-like domain-containing protein
MTEEDLKQIDALLSKTTAGRWFAVEFCKDAPPTNVVSEERTRVASCETEGDAAFIAAAPLIVDRLVCALRASWMREDALTAELEAVKP